MSGIASFVRKWIDSYLIKGHTVKGYTTKGYTVKGYTVKSYDVKGYDVKSYTTKDYTVKGHWRNVRKARPVVKTTKSSVGVARPVFKSEKQKIIEAMGNSSLGEVIGTKAKTVTPVVKAKTRRNRDTSFMKRRTNYLNKPTTAVGFMKNRTNYLKKAAAKKEDELFKMLVDRDKKKIVKVKSPTASVSKGDEFVRRPVKVARSNANQDY